MKSFIIIESLFFHRSNEGSLIDGGETSRDSETSPSCSDRRIARTFDQDETEAANMLGTYISVFSSPFHIHFSYKMVLIRD